MLFLSIQQELDCISDSGCILGRISFDHAQASHIFIPADDSIVLSSTDELAIAERLLGLNLGQYSIPMQDDD